MSKYPIQVGNGEPRLVAMTTIQQLRDYLEEQGYDYASEWLESNLSYLLTQIDMGSKKEQTNEK